jgi:trimeric autotransporter adhesin
MANYNLTSQKIKDTYEQLVQVSGSALVDGTGSLVDTLDYVTNPTFTAYTSSTATSTSASVADLQTQINALEAGSGSAEWTLITGKPAGLVSGSSQIDLAQAYGTASYATTASFALNVTPTPTGSFMVTGSVTDATLTFTKGDGSTFPLTVNNVANATSATLALSASHAVNADNATSATTATSASYASNAELLDSLDSSAFAQVGQNNTFTGTQTFDNITVNGTGSFAYIQSVTGSAKIIGDAFLILNNDTPSQRYGGIKVQDSGSTNVTASLVWDGSTNDWKYEFTNGPTHEGGVLLFGPEGTDLGTFPYPLSNVIQKGTGGHHLADSSITDTGTSVSMSAPLTASGFQGDLDGTASFATSALTASFALNAAGGGGGLETGNSGTDSIKTAASLTTTAAEANGPQSIAIGNAAKVSGTASLHISLDDSNTFAAGDQTINIGKDINNTGGYSTAIGHNLTNTGTGGNVLIGRSVTTAGDYSIGIGEGAQAQQASAVAIGQSARSSGNSVAIGAGAIMGNSYGFAGGYNARANNDASIAVGGDVNVSSNQAIAMGTDTSIDGSSQGAVALGQDADISTSPKAVTLGQGVKATGAAGGIAIGSGSSVTAAAEINIGNRFKFDGTSTITLDASLIKVAVSASATGSLIDNVHPAIASSSAAIEHIVTLTQNQYTALSGSGNINDSTYYIVSDGNTNVWYNDLDVQGNLTVQGQVNSPTFAGGIASNTSSIDFDNGNFATLNASSATFLANPTNLKSGTTYTLIVTNGANISGYGTVWKFAGGTEPTLSANTDVITAVSDGSSLYAAALADFS